jgi:thiol-disulfide isomerase/thioredoxin
MMKKLMVLFLLVSLSIFAITGCDGIGTPNGSEGEGEGEGEEEVEITVLVEAFIADGCANCRVIEPYLEELANEYSREEMILVEEAPWGLYKTDEVRSRYNWYVPSQDGVPYVFFNGTSKIKGISDKDTFKTRIENQRASTPTIQLQASRITDSEGTTITGKVKNISSSTLTNLEINGMIFRNRAKTGFRYSVEDIFEDEKEEIETLSAGEETTFTITIDGLDWDGQNIDGVIFVQSVNHPQKIIRQSLFID